MEILAYILIGIGLLVAAFGGIWIIFKAFQTSIGWGLFTVFCSFGALVWVITHWEDGKKPFLINLGGSIIAILGIVVMVLGGGSFSGLSKPMPPLSVSSDTVTTKPAIPSDQDFIAAVEKGDTDKAIKLLNQGAYVNATNRNGATVLYLAALNGYTDLVKALLEKKANVNLTNNLGMTALFPAAEGGRTEIVNLLIDKGINVNTKTDTGWTALMAAVSKGRKDSTKALIDHGADVNAKTNDDKTVLSLAKRSEIVEMLKTAGASGPMIPDQMVARSKLQEMGITYNKNSLLNCTREGKMDAVKLFLEAGMNPNTANKDGVTPLMYVIYFGDAGVVDMMIQKGADVNAKTVNGRTALMIATENNKANIIQLLKTAGATE
jgi:ankyrin repeat protein